MEVGEEEAWEELETWWFLDTLFWVDFRSLKLLFPLFNAISSSFSSEELSGQAIVKVGR